MTSASDTESRQAEHAMPESTPLLLTVEEAAARLGVGRTFAYALVKSGELESVPVGRLRRVPTECVSEYVQRLRRNARKEQSAA